MGFSEQVEAAGLSRIVKADLEADRFCFDIDQRALSEAEELDGRMLLVTDTRLKVKQVIERYPSLADIEHGLRVLKSDIDNAPVHHRLPECIKAHTMICLLALVLHRAMRQRLRAAGSPLSVQRAPAAGLAAVSTRHPAVPIRYQLARPEQREQRVEHSSNFGLYASPRGA